LKLKTFHYKLIRKSFFLFLDDSLLSIRIKHLLALYLVEPVYFDNFLTIKKDKFIDRLNPDKEIMEPLAKLLEKESDFKLKVLDIGSGPITKVGYKLENKLIELYAIDPLANIYSKLLDRKNIYPPVKTIPGNMRNLSKKFDKNEFHLIYANNCLDHACNPVKAISEIFHVLKPNHYFYFSHFINEGERNNYYGLHQWNFYCINNDLFLASKTKKIEINLSKKFQHMFSIKVTVINRKIIALFLKKEN